MQEQRFARWVLATRLSPWVAVAATFAVFSFVAFYVAQAQAFSQGYAIGNLSPYPAQYGHGNYNSIIYNRSQTSTYGNNNCVYMITAAGNIRGGTIVCDSNQDGQARECLSSATPMSQGVTYLVTAGDYNESVVNNTTYDSGCAI